MNKQYFERSTALCAYQVFSDHVLEKLAKHNIYNGGQLLGATKGLTENHNLFETEEEREMLEQFKILIPENILNEYKYFSFRPPMGLLKKPKQDSHENTD